MSKKIIFTLIVTILLALLSAPTLYAQVRPVSREHLRAVMDPNGDPEAFRREVAAYLGEMQEVMQVYQELFHSLRLEAKSDMNPLSLITEAQRRLPEMSGEDLVVMRTAFARSPVWRDTPLMLDSLIKPQLRQQIQANLAKGSPSIDNDCGAAKRAGITVTDISIAKGVQIALDAVMEAFPTDWLSIVARLISIAAKAASSVAVLTLETLYGINGDCEGEKFETGVNTTLVTLAKDSSVTSLDSYVRTNLSVPTSSLATKLELSNSVTNINANTDTRATEVKGGVNNLHNYVSTTIKGGIDTANTNINAANATLAIIKEVGGNTAAAVGDVNTKLDARLDVKVSSRATQTSVNTLQSTANTINTKADTTLVKLDQTLVRLDELEALIRSFQADNLRLQVEMNFLHGPRYNIAQFQDPGKLALVKTIVEDTIAKGKAAGVPQAVIDQANKEMDAAAEYLKAKGYKDGYAHYRTAYLLIATNPAMQQP